MLRAHALRATAVAVIVFLVVARQVYFARASWSPEMDAWLQRLLRIETMSVIVAIGVDLLSVVGTIFIALPLFILGALLRRGWLIGRRDGVVRLSPFLVGLLWLIALVNHCLFDVNVRVGLPCFASLPLLLIAPGRAARPAALAHAALLGVSLLIGRDLADRLALVGFAAAMALLVRLPPTVLRAGDRLVIALHLAIAAQLAAGLLPLIMPTHGGAFVGDGMAYSYCESARRGVIFASVPGCGTQKNKVHECRQGAIEVIDAHDPSRVTRHPIMSEAYHGRLEQLVCLDDTVQVGMNHSVLEGKFLLESALEFDMDDPTRTRRHVLGEEGGHRVEHDARDDVLYYLGDDVPLLVRRDRRTGKDMRLYREGPASQRMVSGAISQKRRTLFTIGVETPVREFTLDGLVLSATYPCAGGTEITVDDEHDRLFITGFFGLEVIDLKTGRSMLRRLLGGIPRRPTIDEKNGVVYVPNLMGGKLHVFDRQSLTLLGTVPLGAGSRYPLVSLDGRYLFAGNLKAHYVFAAPALVRQLREGR